MSERYIQSVHGTTARDLQVGDVIVAAHFDGSNRLLPVRTLDLVGDDVVINQGTGMELNTSWGNLVVTVALG